MKNATAVRLIALLLAVALGVAACGDDGDGTKAPSGDGSGQDDEKSDGPKLRDDSLTIDTAVDGLEQPTNLAFAGNDLLITEKATGRVKLVRSGQIVGDAIDLAVNSFDERGLLGVAVHPDFSKQPFVYLHWTWRGEGDGEERLLGTDTEEEKEVPALGNRIDRFRFADDRLTFDRNIVEFPSNTLESDTSGRVRGNHDAGPLAFGPDGKLYVQMGDQNLRGQLQNIKDGPPADDAHLAGVILRLNDDGTTPQDNPFFAHGASTGGEVGENIQKIYAYGIRNSFGLAFEPGSGALWQTENGDDSYDEVNVFAAGANSGWIQVQGPPESLESYKRLEVESKDGLDVATFPPNRIADEIEGAKQAMFSLPGSAYSAPVFSWVRPPAVTAIGFVADARLGPASKNTAWFGTVLTDSLLRYEVAPDGRSLALEGPLADKVDDNESKGDLGESEGNVVGTGFGVITDIDQSPDGSLYVVSLDSGNVYRISVR